SVLVEGDRAAERLVDRGQHEVVAVVVGRGAEQGRCGEREGRVDRGLRGRVRGDRYVVGAVQEHDPVRELHALDARERVGAVAAHRVVHRDDVAVTRDLVA